MQTANSIVTIDDERVRVTRWTFEPGQRTGTHEHELPYVVVPVTGGELRLETSEGSSRATQAAGESYVRDVGAVHDVVNAGTEVLVFVEIELKSR